MNDEIRGKIHRIMDLCLDAKELGHDCFFGFSAHVDKLDIDIHLFGWKKGVDPDYANSVYIDEKLEESKLNEILNYLEKLIFSKDREIILQGYKNKFDKIMKINKRNSRDFELSEMMTNMEDVFSIPSFNDETFNNNNPDIMELYKSISDERSFVKNLRVV